MGGLGMVEKKWEEVRRSEGGEEEVGVSDGY